MCKIILKDINGNGDFPVLLERKLDRLQETAPSDSSITSRFLKMSNNMFHGLIDVAFGEGRFTAEKAGSNLEELSEGLLKLIDSQIQKWKQTRFEEGSGAGFNGEAAWRVAV